MKHALDQVRSIRFLHMITLIGLLPLCPLPPLNFIHSLFLPGVGKMGPQGHTKKFCACMLTQMLSVRDTYVVDGVECKLSTRLTRIDHTCRTKASQMRIFVFSVKILHGNTCLTNFYFYFLWLQYSIQ